MWMRALSLAAVLLWTAGCGGGDERPLPQDARVSSPDANAGPPMITLSVTSAKRLQRVAPSPNISPKPGNGNMFVGVELSLSNLGEAVPLPIKESTFSLETSARVDYQTSSLTAAAVTPCPTGAAVFTGGSLSCQVVFEVPWGAVPSYLRYDDDSGRSATAAVANLEPAQILCSGWPTSSNCSSCISFVASSPDFCKDELAAVSAACGSPSCFDLSSCPIPGAGCVTPLSCQATVDSYQGCLYDGCRSNCL